MRLITILCTGCSLWVGSVAGYANQSAGDAHFPASIILGGGKKKPAPKKPVIKTYPFSGEIATYSEKSLVIKGEGDLSDRKYVITPKTQYVGAANKPASYRDLRMHKWVNLILLHTPSGIDEVVKVDFNAKKPVKTIH